MEDINDYGRFESFYKASPPRKREEEAREAQQPLPVENPFRFEKYTGSPISGAGINTP